MLGLPGCEKPPWCCVNPQSFERAAGYVDHNLSKFSAQHLSDSGN